jgi:peptidoglycan/xylan/chitin deacetylase (PgdA/CDA1 family)
LKDNPSILLTFDVEEFDLPLEYNIPISTEEQLNVGKKGLDAIMPILYEVKATLFTTAHFASNYSAEIKELSVKHEIASHAYYHSSFKKEDLLNSRAELERIIQKPVTGLRMPLMRQVDIEWVKEAGYKYDSSINPTWIPGRYNNRDKPRTVYFDQGMTRLPASVSPNFRIPLFWLAFKNFPYWVFKQLAFQTLRKDGYLSLYFHPWEFTDISQYRLPFYAKRHAGKILVDRLSKLVDDLKPYGEFKTINTFLTEYQS